MNEFIRMNYYLISGIALLLGTLPFIRKIFFRSKVNYPVTLFKRHIILFITGLDLIFLHIILSIQALMFEFSGNPFYYFVIVIILLKSTFIAYGIMNVLDSKPT